ncbi:Calx-beta domain-containing protein [Altericista sp. CCNU0014]|uniref:Calx-beta domain-containing protein n=1 Tax=Altericista sp. CCNU0014 TaxID=3082949 RepID=UPI00384FF388
MERLDPAQPILNNSGALDAGANQQNAFVDPSQIGSSSPPQPGQESLPIVGPDLVPIDAASVLPIFPLLKDGGEFLSQDSLGSNTPEGIDPLTGSPLTTDTDVSVLLASLIATETVLAEAKMQAATLLSQWLDSPVLLDNLHEAFGESWNPNDAEALVKDLASGNGWPEFVVLEGNVLDANGAFSQETNTIYVSNDFLNRNAGNPSAVTSVLLEEVGHYIDSKLNATDSPGDEGQLFAALVLGKTLDDRSLLAIQAEDDHRILILNDQNLEIEESSITGGSGNDTLIGTAGNDQLSGGDGDDTINAGLGIDNVDGGAGNDLLIVDYSSNTYVGPGLNAGVSSSVSSNGTGGSNGSYFAYRASDYGNYDQVNFSNIERFEITGTVANDTLTTGAGNDIIIGGAGNDTVNAQGGNDRLIGVNQKAITPGLGEIDTLNGGTGSDIYVIGNSVTTFYDDGNTTTAGVNDYVRIVGFNSSEDLIQLTGPKSNYILGTSPVAGVTGTAVFINKPDGEPDELIAIIEGVTGLNLASNVFIEAQNESGLFSFSQPTFSTLESSNATVTIARELGSLGAASVTLDLTDGTATAPNDYSNNSITVNFADGETSKVVTIPIINDTAYELNETVNLTLINPTGGAALGAQKAATLTIVDNDAQPGTVEFGTTTYSVNENGTPITAVTLVRTGGSDGVVSVTLTPSNSTANTPSDFSSSPITVNFANGETTKTVNIPIVNDSLFEGNETINLALSNPTGGTALGTQTAATLTIVDNDAQPTITIAPAILSQNEGDGGTTALVFAVSLSNPSTQTITVNFATSNGTATSGVDYVASSGTLTFNPGETNQTITVLVNGDMIFEPNESFSINLTSPTNATLGTTISGNATIVNDDIAPLQPGTLAFSAVTYSVNENGIPIPTITIVREGGSDGAVSVTLAPSDGTANAPSDFINNLITVNFANGETNKTVTIPIADDSLSESAETINLALINPTGGATIGAQSSATLTILDNDTLPDLAISGAAPATMSLGETASVSWNVTNQGTLALNGTPPKDAVYLSNDTTLDNSDILLAQASGPNALPIGDSYSQAANITLNDATQGDRYLLFATDVDGHVLESNENNNVFAHPITLQAPDLSVSNVSLADATLKQPGQKTTVNWTVSNSGTSEAKGTWIDRVYLSANGTVNSAILLASVTRNTPLAVGEVYTASTQITLPVVSDGNYRIIVVADANNSLLEGTGESNNQQVSTDTISIGHPDLVAAITSPASVATSGTTLPFNWRVTNQGSAETLTAWTDRIYLSNNATFDANDLLLGQVNAPNLLAPGASYDARADLNIPLDASGNRYLLLVTDAGNTVPEQGDENNNTVASAIAITLAPYADLAPTSVTIPALVIGDPATVLVGWTVTNQGTGVGIIALRILLRTHCLIKSLLLKAGYLQTS